MRRIALDASCWRDEADLWNDLLAALRAPSWHGSNLDALDETVREAAHPPHPEWGYSNGVQPPYAILVSGARHLNAQIRQRLERVQAIFDDARTRHHIEASFTIED